MKNCCSKERNIVIKKRTVIFRHCLFILSIVRVKFEFLQPAPYGILKQNMTSMKLVIPLHFIS